MRKLLPLLVFVALVGGACGDGDGDSESASATTEARQETTETTSKPKATEPEADAQAQLACGHFRNVSGDIASGVLTPEQVTTKLQEVYGTARRSESPGVGVGAQKLLAAWNSGDLDGVRAGIKALDAACKRAGQ